MRLADHSVSLGHKDVHKMALARNGPKALAWQAGSGMEGNPLG